MRKEYYKALEAPINDHHILYFIRVYNDDGAVLYDVDVYLNGRIDVNTRLIFAPIYNFLGSYEPCSPQEAYNLSPNEHIDLEKDLSWTLDE